MQIDVRTINITPLRQTFDHLARRFGDKPSSRYQEGSYDIQAAENLHYKPTWDPEQDLYDYGNTKIVMEDWYALKDSRQYFYSPYVLARSRQQDATETNFKFVESRGLHTVLPHDLREEILQVLVPLRHVAWGANQNNTFICGYGYGVTFTQPCMYHAMDNLGIAQYLSRIGLLLGDVEALEQGKTSWLEAPAWQPLRRYVEDCLVLRDPFELFVAQNVALDGLLYPLIYETIVDGYFSARGASTVAMLTQFMNDWSNETNRWIDGVLKVAAKESDRNADALGDWISSWSQRAAAALVPVVELVMAERVDEVVGEQVAEFRNRIAKTGIKI